MRQILGPTGWTDSQCQTGFRAVNPATREAIGEQFPFSHLELSDMCEAAHRAWRVVLGMPPDTCPRFLKGFADAIEADKENLAGLAHLETGLPVKPRFFEVEIPAMARQLRVAAGASWRNPIIDADNNIRSGRIGIGPVAIFGPNNFPFRFNGMGGGDFAAAVTAGNPVIVKANPGHPETTFRLAQLAEETRRVVGLPDGFLQMFYNVRTADIGLSFVTNPMLASVAFTGSKAAGLPLKVAAEGAGKTFYGEFGAVNPVVLLPDALAERSGDIVTEFLVSVLMGTGQFCTNPGLLILMAGELTEHFLDAVAQKFMAGAPGVLLSEGVMHGLGRSVSTLISAGAVPVCGGGVQEGVGYGFPNTLLRVSGGEFLDRPNDLQTEAFGNVSLAVVVENEDELVAVLQQLEGSLTGSIYTAREGSDEALYQKVAFELELKVGRLLNDKMPTGVTLSPAMVHGGPFPASSHPGFTAVGLPASIDRFTRPLCRDGVRFARLPGYLV